MRSDSSPTETSKTNDRQLARVIYNSSDAMIVADKEGIVLFVNPATETLFERESRSFIGAPFGFPFVGAGTTELDVVTRSGETRIAEMRVMETKWKGKPAYLASIRDITEVTRLKRMEEVNRKILEQQEKRMEEERLKVILQMADATAHEFNQPLTVLLSNVELLTLNSNDPKTFTECLQDIKTSGKKIADIVKKVRDIRHYETKPYGKSASIIDIDQDIRILSIENSDDYFTTIKAVLQSLAHVNLIRARNIAGAISLLSTGNIDLILLSYTLPDGTGLDFMEKARENNIDTPVVVLTGQGNDMTASRLIQEGACDYLTKSVFNPENISRCIGYALEKTRLQREIHLAQNKMAHMATTDALTGLHNHRYFFEALEQEKARVQRYGTDLVICMIDLDHFKRINDNYGHPAGDTILSEIGKLLRHWARKSDIPCRYGGEEFVVVLPATNLEGGIVVSERLRRMVAEHRFAHEGLTLNVTISIGIAYYDKAAQQTASSLVNKADKALYRAKKEGRNRVAVT